MYREHSQNADNNVRPVVLICRCIGFDHCRWNGNIIVSPFVEKLKNYIEFITVCPEADISLGIPRKPLRLVKQGNRIVMLQHTSDLDVTTDMNTFSSKFLAALQPIDGFLYKERSPSCGISNVKIYTDNKKGSAANLSGSGLFGAAFKSTFPLLPYASAGQLYNYRLREHFYTQIYTLARFRTICNTPEIKKLVDFHANHELIVMKYNRAIMGQLGMLASNYEHRDVRAGFENYYRLLCNVLARPPEIMSSVNVLMHALGYFSEKITINEKLFFLDLLEQYRQKKIPLSACNAVLKSWIVRFDEKYLAAQLFFSPFPQALLELSDSAK